ncbi:hypothetical protein PC41400_04060 [Paenibacillus chitinolyticus]|uniref:Transposase n=1 Tax=Paenibacillus chitinolyticus TaxID=79263 RepID=A0A410WRD0_9BACL|nr:hypothetical protein PC41400_04060 [Paenibacillus chitinolyticus]GKS12186.1 hypothetical protein YDYSY3_31860 [Paenibacillus chitinolyticus]
MRWFQNTDIFGSIFVRIFQEAVQYGFVEPDILFIDATHAKANGRRNLGHRCGIRTITCLRTSAKSCMEAADA